MSDWDLERFLIEGGFITPEQLEKARKVKEATRQHDLLRVLVDLGFVTEAKAARIKANRSRDSPDDAGVDKELIDTAHILRTAHTIIQQALREEDLEIHIVPGADSVRVYFLREGEMAEKMRLPQRLYAGLVTRYKLMADMDVAVHTTPQVGQVRITVDPKGSATFAEFYEHHPNQHTLRVQTLPTPFGEKISFALVPPP